MATTKKILIVIDVQKDFITGALKNATAANRLPNIVNLVRNERFAETYVTMDTHGPDYLTDTLEGEKLPVKHCIEGTDGWKMPEELKDALDKNQNVVEIFKKPTFGSTWMANYLYETLSHEQVEFTIVGFCSDICVVSNALMLRANFPNSKITVRRDCTAGVTPESNDAALLTMKMCQIEII